MSFDWSVKSMVTGAYWLAQPRAEPLKAGQEEDRWRRYWRQQAKAQIKKWTKSSGDKEHKVILAELRAGKIKRQRGRPKTVRTTEQDQLSFILNKVIPHFIAQARSEGQSKPIMEGLYYAAKYLNEEGFTRLSKDNSMPREQFTYEYLKNLWGRKKRGPKPPSSN